MPNPAAVGDRRLRKTKAQLIEEIVVLEGRIAASGPEPRFGAAPRAPADGRVASDQELAHLSRLVSENPNPLLSVAGEFGTRP